MLYRGHFLSCLSSNDVHFIFSTRFANGGSSLNLLHHCPNTKVNLRLPLCRHILREFWHFLQLAPSVHRFQSSERVMSRSIHLYILVSKYCKFTSGLPSFCLNNSINCALLRENCFSHSSFSFSSFLNSSFKVSEKTQNDYYQVTHTIIHPVSQINFIQQCL